MPDPTPAAAATLAGRVFSGLMVLFFAFDGGAKLFRPQFVTEGMAKFGYPDGCIVPLGAVLLLCTLLYALPRTAVLGAMLLTGYLGGAVATHVRAGDPLFTHVLAPVWFGVAVWLGLLLRRPALRRALFAGR